jgi:hypothetical protein
MGVGSFFSCGAFYSLRVVGLSLCMGKLELIVWHVQVLQIPKPWEMFW